MGRGHQCDLRISDISVSRVHALLKYKDGRFLVFDNESKFGTLIYLNRNYQIQNDKAAIQIGRTVFTFVLKHIKNSPQIPEPRNNV
jgi:pSer/pThr/pTyr-binding forkhead associated (FHA) protein